MYGQDSWCNQVQNSASLIYSCGHFLFQQRDIDSLPTMNQASFSETLRHIKMKKTDS